VDYFKPFNDHYGHGTGDACLIQIAQALQAGMNRPMDLLARYGGEEFVALLPGTSLEGACNVAESLRQIVASLRIPHAGSSIAEHVTISVGVACRAQSDPKSTSFLLRQADQALYQAKQSGRNKIRYI